MDSQSIVYGVKHGKCANITGSVKVYYDFTIVIFMKWSPNAGKICCLGWFWVVAGRVGQVALETRLILMEKKTLGGNWSGLYRQVAS